MKKYDILWIAVILILFALIAIPATRNIFMAFTSAHAYLAGFIKFAILATMGDLLAQRIVGGDWRKPSGFVFRVLVWGFLGMAITLIFTVFSAGVGAAIEKGLLPGEGLTLAAAFLTSLLMNLTFGPAMMIFHRLTDTYIDLLYRKTGRIGLAEVVKTVDWQNFYGFVVCKTIPFFWIPAHTVVFLLAPEYRVLAAAALSVALGLILALAKRRSQGVPEAEAAA